MSNYQNTKQDGRNLRRNRSDGRLKTYKSSDDCRAWTLNKRERQDYISGYIASSYEKFQGDASEWGRFVPVPVLVDIVVQSYKDELHKLHSKLQKVQQELLDCEEGKNFPTGKRHVKSEDIQVEEAIEEPALFTGEETDHEVQTGNIYRRDQSQEDNNEGEYSKGDKHAIMEEEYEREEERQQQLKNASLQKNLINGTDSDSRTQNIRETLAEINTDFDKLMSLKDKEIKSLISMQDSIPQRVSNEEWDTSFQNEYPDFYENLKQYENDVEEKEREVKDLLQSIELQVMEEEKMRNSRMGKDDESRTNDFSNRDRENMLKSGMYDGKNSQDEEFAKLRGELDILSVRLSALESSGEKGDVDKYDRQKEREHFNEIQDLQDNLMVCKKALKNERLEKEKVENQLEKCVEEMFRSKNMADEKDRELSNLKDKLIRSKEEKEKLELKLDSLSTSERRSSKQVELSEELISELESQHTKEVKSFIEKVSQMKKQLREREEEMDELQDKYKKLLEQCDNLKERLKGSDASSENDNMKSQLVGYKQKLSEIEERYQLLLGEYERLKRDQTKESIENSKQLANELMEKLRECEEEKAVLRKRLEKLEDLQMNQNDLQTASEHEKTKAFNDELSKKNDSLKLDLENALTQLKHKTGSIDTLNETLNIMKERLEDRDKELVELRETNEELLGEFLFLKQKCAEENTVKDQKLSELEDMLTKCGKDKRNLEIEFERSTKEFAEMKESYEKLLEKRDLELHLNELENEIAEQKNNYEKLLKECQTQLKYAEEHLDKKDKELSELKMKLKNCGDDRKELEINKQKLENELAGMKNTYGNILEEYQTLQMKHKQEKQDNEALQRQNLMLSEQMLQDCENEKKNLKKQLEKLETQLNLAKQETIKCREEAVAKQKGFCDELEKENRNLKAELENALSQLNYRNSTIGSLNEKLSLMEIELKDREKQISESEERHKKLLEEYQQVLRREEINLADNISAKIPLTSLADNVHIENLADKNVLNKDQSEDSKEKIKAEQMEREAEMNQEKINITNGESEVSFTKSKKVEADKEIADILLHHQTCSVCKMEAERILGAIDEDNKKSVETERSENGSKVKAGNKEERNPLESNKEDQTLNTKQGGEQQQGVTVSEDKPNLDYAKASSVGRTRRPSRDREEQPTMDSPLEDSDIASAEQMPLSKVDTSENKQTTNAGMNLDSSVISSNIKVATNIKNKDTEKEIADILLHHQTCTVCKNEAARILSIVDESEDTLNSIKATSLYPQSEERKDPYTTPIGNETEADRTLAKENIFGDNTLPGRITSEKLGSSEVEAAMKSQNKKDINKFTSEHQRERLTKDSGAKGASQIKDDKSVTENTGNMIETFNASINKKEVSITEDKNADKEIADTLLHHQKCTICKKEAGRILGTVDEGENYAVTVKSTQENEISKQNGSLEKFADNVSDEVKKISRIGEDKDDKDSKDEESSKDEKYRGKEKKENVSEEDGENQIKETLDSTKTLSDHNREEPTVEITNRADGGQTSKSRDDAREEILDKNYSDIHLEKFVTIIEDNKDSLLETEKENPQRELAEMKIHHQACTECKEEVERSLHLVEEGDKKIIETQGNENSKGIDSKEITSQSKGDIKKEKKIISFSTTPLGDEMLTDKVNEIELFNEDGSLTKFMDHIVGTAQTIAGDEEQRQSSDELPAKQDKGGDDQDIENASKQVRLESGLELTTDDEMNDCSSEQTEYGTWVFREEIKQVPYINEKCLAENESKQNNILKTTESWADLATAVNIQPQSFNNGVQSLEFRIVVDLDVSDNVSPEKRIEFGFNDEINEKSISCVNIPLKRITEEDKTDITESKKTMDKEDKKKEPNSMNLSYLSINYGKQSAPEVKTTEKENKIKKEGHRFRNKISDDEVTHIYQELININKTEVLPALKEIDIFYQHKKCFICMEKLKHILDEVKFNPLGTERIESMIEEAETLLHHKNCDACIEEAGRILDLLGEIVHETGTSRYEKYDVTDNEVKKNDCR